MTKFRYLYVFYYRHHNAPRSKSQQIAAGIMDMKLTSEDAFYGNSTAELCSSTIQGPLGL